jgi:hypothetical protein
MGRKQARLIHSLIQDIQLHHATDCQLISACNILRGHQSTHQVQCSYCDKSLTSEARYRRNYRSHGILSHSICPDIRDLAHEPICTYRSSKLNFTVGFYFQNLRRAARACWVGCWASNFSNIPHQRYRETGPSGHTFRSIANQPRQNTSIFSRTFCWSRNSGRQIGFKLSDPKV